MHVHHRVQTVQTVQTAHVAGEVGQGLHAGRVRPPGPAGMIRGRVFVTRFAPSPTGPLHLGHALAALTVWDAAQAAGGRCLLRIEDIDHTRARPEWEAGALEDLAWLGLRWEQPVRRQSEHMADYAAALERLRLRGLLRRDFRSRREQAQAAASAPHGPEAPVRGGPEPDQAARLARGEPFAWRLSLDAARGELGEAAWAALAYRDAAGGERRVEPERAGDVVLARKDVGVAYHLACVVDDALQGVTHVIRGEDLREAVHPQRLLQALLGLPAPHYRHHPLVLGPDGRRLAKRTGAEPLAALRARGVTPAEVRAAVGLPPAGP